MLVNNTNAGESNASPKLAATGASSSSKVFGTGLQARVFQTYKFAVSKKDLDTIKETLPLVGEAGAGFTKHFYSRMFKANPELRNLFNQTNQKFGGQPKKLLKTVAVAASAAIETGELPGELIEGICQKHASLNVKPEHYAIVGEHLIGTIKDLLTTEDAVIDAWKALYKDVASVFASRESELYEELRNTPGGWIGKRTFTLAKKEPMSSTITRFTFAPVDGGDVPEWKAGKFTTVWTKVDASGPHETYTEQPRHYTLNVQQDSSDTKKVLSISVKKDGLVSSILHDSREGSAFDLSAPFGCFDLSGIEHLWLDDDSVPVVFLSGGVGVTPVLAMLESIYVTRPATWLHASRDGSVHAYRDRLREIAAVRDGNLIRRVWYSDPLPTDGKPGGGEESELMFNLAKFHYHGRMDLPTQEKAFPPQVLHLDNKSTQYYMCGPPGFMDAQKKGLTSLGVDENRIHWEGFA